MEKRFKEYLEESSLKRIWQHTQNHDTGTITAFRYATDCGKGEVYTKRQNIQRNKSLLAKLQRLGYGVTSVKDSYIENYGSADAKEVGENVYFVVDIKDTGKLQKDMEKLGAEFDQDSILFIAKGGESASLVGTNSCPDGYPGKGKSVKLGSRSLGKGGEFFTRVSGRPFTFESIDHEHAEPKGYFGKLGLKAIAESRWQDIEVDCEDE